MDTLAKLIDDLINQRNGEIMVGVAQGADMSLEFTYKLHVAKMAPYNVSDVRENIAVGISNFPWSRIEDAKVTVFLLEVIFAVNSYGFIPSDGSNNDVIIGEVKVEDLKEFGMVPRKEHIDLMVGFIVAYKLNFLATNHNIGQGEISGYARKYLMFTLNIPDNEVRRYYNTAHTVSHWADTHLVLGKLSMSRVMEVNSTFGVDQRKPLADAQLRMASNPAGTVRLTIAYAITQKLKDNMLLKFFPGFDVKAENSSNSPVKWTGCCNYDLFKKSLPGIMVVSSGF